MRIYPTIFRVVFQGMDPEKAHHLSFNALRLAEKFGVSGVYRKLCAPKPSLSRTVMGIDFPSPFGLAAGFDKEGAGIMALADLGFGHVEVGTITGAAQPGNEQPRLFRLVEDKAVINRMGFNNAGAHAVAPRIRDARMRLRNRFGAHRPIIGVNIGKTKVVELDDAIADYLISTRELAAHADYLVVNVSSPNTPGLRLLQGVETLRPLLGAVGVEADRVAGRHVPLLVKIAPDLTDADIADVAALATELKLDGIIATNTTIAREPLVTDAFKVAEIGAGGLSGAPLKARSLEVLKVLREKVPADMAIISVGGISSGADVIERLAAGADLVQGYTAFLYEGPAWVRSINKELAEAVSRGERLSAK
ncbi:quinone-dependent dihydroorotate dehydrogenase [Paeniglutamicibacter sp. Y32M11]|uniref:quinone-dependent dihydroorotate dehydrogenase n=1 Tax=Paeniglutamicibacter sp. Y32M11 TaxID=2853258 RepID=UPI001C529823|nr:quinone-dependent dihydroorotate dehydrogenase [Paeniglutamicibacter sp. Y32M11]QXQ11916.1 quinone-dependent dihydroorotate dehydrogenase [Paeniglutamicibacter sp. Y32M11]